MNILLEDFNAKVGKKDIFKPVTGIESLHEISNDTGVRIVNFTTSKNLTVKHTMFQQCSICKYTWMSPDRKPHKQSDHIMYLMADHSGQQIVILDTIRLWQI
jgi:hypothetical protein